MTQPSVSRQLYALVHRLPTPSTKRGAGTKAKVFLGELAANRGYAKESTLINTTHYNLPLAEYRTFYGKLGVLSSTQNAKGEWVYKLSLDRTKAYVKALIESGDTHALSSLNTPNYECFWVSLDKVFPEYILGTDDWLRVMAKTTTENRQSILFDVQRDVAFDATSRCEAALSAKQAAG
jgi:hypothetical protein